MVNAYDVIKWQNVRKLIVNTLALPYTTSSEKCFLVWLHVFEIIFGCWIWVSPEPAVNLPAQKLKLQGASWIFLNDHFPGQNKAQRHIQDLQQKRHVHSFILWLK